MKAKPSRRPKNVKGGWWYEDERGIDVLAQRPGADALVVRLMWTELLKAARRCGVIP
jgi:hypothetical protein